MIKTDIQSYSKLINYNDIKLVYVYSQEAVK